MRISTRRALPETRTIQQSLYSKYSQSSDKGKEVSTKGGTETSASSRRCAMSRHAPFVATKAFSVLKTGSSNQRCETPSRA